MSTLRVDNINARTGTTISVPTGTSVYLPGHVIQVQQSDVLSTWSASSATPVDVTGMSVSITPKSTSSKILVYVSMHIGLPDDNYGYVLLLRNGVSIGTGTEATGSRKNTFMSATQTALGGPNGWRMHVLSRSYLDSPATVSTLTYKMQMASPYLTGTMYLNRQYNDADSTYTQRPGSCISVMEIAQ